MNTLFVLLLSVSVYGLGQRPRPQIISSGGSGQSDRPTGQNNGSSWNGPTGPTGQNGGQGGRPGSIGQRPQPQAPQMPQWPANGPNSPDDGRDDAPIGLPDTNQWLAGEQDSRPGKWDVPNLGGGGDQWNGPKPQTDGSSQGSQWTGNGGNSGNSGNNGNNANNDEQHWDEPQKESGCYKIIPRNPKTIGLTQLVRVDKTITSSYMCDPDSRLKDISYSNTISGPVTCNGFVVNTNDIEFDVTQVSPKGKMRKEKLLIGNFTQLQSFNNGNYEYTECGIISAGRCAGDLFWGFGIYRADDQYGCQGEGVSGQTAIVRRVEIKGKCGSKCSLGISTVIYSSPVSNQGLMEKSLDFDDSQDSGE